MVGKGTLTGKETTGKFGILLRVCYETRNVRGIKDVFFYC